MNSILRLRDTIYDGQVPSSGARLIVGSLAESIMYVCALIADQPRAIDRYIDYFGEPRPARRVAPLAAIAVAAARPAVSNQRVAAAIRKA